MPPEIKIVLYVFFAVALFVLDSLYFYLGILAAIILVFLWLPRKTWKAGLIPITIFLSFTFLSNVLNRHGRIIFSSGILVITDEGLTIAALRTLRVLFMIAGAKIMMAVTGMDETIRALGRLLGPFEKLGIPVKDFFHTMGLTVKCLPALKDIAYQAYAERMNDSGKRGFWERAKIIAAFLLPLFVKSIRSPEIFFGSTEIDEKNN